MFRPSYIWCLIVLCVVSCSGPPPTAPASSASESSNSGESHLARITERGILRMLCFPHQNSHFVHPDLEVLRAAGVPLAELRDPTAYVGIDVDFIGAFAESLGVKLEVHPITTGYADLIPALLADRGDLIASSLTITEKREEIIDFSEPYHTSWVTVVMASGKSAESIEDLAGLRGVLMTGSSQLDLIRSFELENIEIEETSYTLENYLALDEGRADFTLVDSSSEPGKTTNSDFPDLLVAFRLKAFNYGVALPPGSDVVELLNDFIRKMNADGTIQQLLARHPDQS